MIHPVNSEELYYYIDNVSNEKLVILEFTAKWCRPCNKINPDLERIAETHNSIAFVKVDIDKFQDIPLTAEISSMPTFRFLKNKNIVFQFTGAGGASDIILEKIEELKK